MSIVQQPDRIVQVRMAKVTGAWKVTVQRERTRGHQSFAERRFTTLLDVLRYLEKLTAHV